MLTQCEETDPFLPIIEQKDRTSTQLSQLEMTNSAHAGDVCVTENELVDHEKNQKSRARKIARTALFVGVFLVLLIAVIATGFCHGLPCETAVNHDSALPNLPAVPFRECKKWDWRLLIRIYRGPFLSVSMAFLMALNVYAWRKAKLNANVIFQLEEPHSFSERHFLEVGGLSGSLWSISLLVFFYGTWLGVFHSTVPIIMLSILLIGFFNPFPVLCLDVRKWIMKVLLRIVKSPLEKEGFAESFLADQFVSLAQALQDVQLMVVFYACQFSWDFSRPTPSKVSLCDSISSTIRPAIGVLPAWFRFAQCVRSYYDTKLAYPHLVNAGKYSQTVFVVLFVALNTAHAESYKEDSYIESPAFWLCVVSYIVNSSYTFWFDVHVDWGLFDWKSKEHFMLRDVIRRHVFYYYFAIFQDLVLRFGWIYTLTCTVTSFLDTDVNVYIAASAELWRRFIWNFFRVEHEHLINLAKSNSRDTGERDSSDPPPPHEISSQSAATDTAVNILD